jgi:TolB protein
VIEPDFNPAPPAWQAVITSDPSPTGRASLVALEDVTAPQPLLQDAVNEAYDALRSQAALETGWDALSSLENAYLPLTSPTLPTLQEDWLYTGRAFALNPLLLSADWLRIVREDYQGQTFWRVYLRARYQDGSMGAPLKEMIWDLNARYEGDTTAYEQGGRLGQVPSGYWIDFTEIAGRFGWQRLPSWINWRTYYPAIRFNQFVITGGLEWRQSMAELYPPEALMTATSLPTYTATPTRTPAIPARALTETPTPTLTTAPTRRPTWTPQP